MRRYLLDSGIASDLINSRLGVDDKAEEAARRGDRLGIATPVLGELLYGVENCDDPERNRKRLWRRLRRVSLWPFDKAAAIEYGRIAAELKRIGRPMQQIDIQIAAVALTLGNCTVVSKDSDLAAVPGLTVVDWSKNG